MRQQLLEARLRFKSLMFVLDSLRGKGVKSTFGLHPLTNSKGGIYTLQIHLNQVEILIPASKVEIPGQNDRPVPSTTGQIVIHP